MATKLIKDQKATLKVVNCLSRGKAFIVFLEGEAVPVIIAKRIAADDGIVHRSQLIGQTIDVTPTQPTNGGQPGWLASVELPLVDFSANRMLAQRQQRANDYAQAALYTAEVVEA